MAPSPWALRTGLQRADRYCNEIFEKILTPLTAFLNEVHNQNFSSRYWRILIGPWLRYFIAALYDRYIRLEMVFQYAPSFYTNIIPPQKCQIIPHEIMESGNLIRLDNIFNLKMFSLIGFNLFPDNIEILNVDDNFFSRNRTTIPESKTRSIWAKKIIYDLIQLTEGKKEKEVILAHLGFSFFEILKLKMSFGWKKLGLNYPGVEKKIRFSPENNSFSAVRNEKIIGGKGRFEEFLYGILPKTIPKAYMENYQQYRDVVKSAPFPKAIGSSEGWHSVETFKFFAAEARENGTLTMEFAQGGSYHKLVNMSYAIFEDKDVVFESKDKFNSNRATYSLPNPALSIIKNTHREQNDKILFIGNIMAPYFHRIITHILPEDVPGYFSDKKVFLSNLETSLKEKIWYRPYPAEVGWGEIDWCIKNFPTMVFATKGTAENLMKKARMVVTDFPSSTYFLAFSIGVPCVLFWDPDIHLVAPEAQSYFDNLRKAGILHDSPESAASKVNEVYQAPMSWWKSPHVQNVKDEFCQHFARTSDDWVADWKKELLKITKQ